MPVILRIRTGAGVDEVKCSSAEEAVQMATMFGVCGLPGEPMDVRVNSQIAIDGRQLRALMAVAVSY